MNRLLRLATTLMAPALLAAQAPQAPDSVIPAPDATLPRTHAPERTVTAITAQDLMTRLYIYADDSMMGREAGTAGNAKATDYLAAEARRLGLVPAGDSGTYFQTIPLRTRLTDSASTLIAAGAALAFGSEWAALGGGGSLAEPALQAIYGGVLGDSTTPLTPEQTAGKLVVYTPPAQQGRRLRMAGQGAQGYLVAVVVPDQFMGFARRPSSFMEEPSADGARPAQRPTILLSAAGAGKLFDAPFDQLKPGDLGKAAALDLRVRVESFPFPSRNVVAILPGRDAKLKGQYVAIGAHNDHVGANARPVDHDSIRIFNHIVRPGGAEDGMRQPTAEQQAEVNRQLAAFRAAHPGAARQDSIANGADDDGSGSVSVLEIAQRLVGGKPKLGRSVLFVWHVGEEKGLLGSRFFTDHPTVPRDSIVAELNLDMVGRGDAWDITGKSREGAVLRGGPAYLQIVGSRRLSTELGDLIERVNTDGHHNLVLDYAMDATGHPANIYCRSDHYEYARFGIPIAFFTTGVHSDYHQVTDEPMYIDYEHLARVTNFVADVAVRLANLEHRVVVDQPKPEPGAPCRQ